MAKDTGYTVAGYPLLYDSREGYSVETDKHTYCLYELTCLGGRATSDIIMVMVDDYARTQNDYDVPTSIGWTYGATSFPEADFTIENISKYIEDYEKSH